MKITRYSEKESGILLSVLIATVRDREAMLNELLGIFSDQISHYFINSGRDLPVEIIVASDNKEISIGNKRQQLLEESRGKFVCFFDDDDSPNGKYLEMLVNVIEENEDIDCIGIRGVMTTNGIDPKTWCHRLGYKIIGDGNRLLPEGYHYIRPIIHFNPVLRERAIEAGFKDLRYGEDMDYAGRLELKKEYFLDQTLFHYRYSNKEAFKKKYGII